jgi:hypothetical protein
MNENSRVDILFFPVSDAAEKGCVTSLAHGSHQVHHDGHGKPGQTLDQKQRESGHTQTFPETLSDVVSRRVHVSPPERGVARHMPHHPILPGA